MTSFTNGKEYTLNGNPYIGPYNIVDGTTTAYTGTSYVFGISKPLTPIKDKEERIDVGIYSELNQYYYTKERWEPTSYYPILTDEDKNNGYVFRYFTQRANSNTNRIVEISEKEFKVSKLYKFAKIKWYIDGETQELIDLNRDEVIEGCKCIPNMSKILRNYLELKIN